MPFSGAIAAWADLPWNLIFTRFNAKDLPSTVVVSLPCIMKARSKSSNTPSRAITSLPLAVSSAGVPYTTNVQGACNVRFKAIAAVQMDGPCKLWPQAWPKPSRASYSQSNPILGPPPFTWYTALNAVLRPLTSRSTVKPSFSNKFVNNSWAWNSSFPSSGWSKMKSFNSFMGCLNASISCKSWLISTSNIHTIKT